MSKITVVGFSQAICIYIYIYMYMGPYIHIYIYIYIRCISMQEKPRLGAKKLMELIEDHMTTSLE